MKVKAALLRRMPWLACCGREGPARYALHVDGCSAENVIDLLELAAGVDDPEEFLRRLPEERRQSLLSDAYLLKCDLPGLPAISDLAQRVRNIDPSSTDGASTHRMPCVLAAKMKRGCDSCYTCFLNLGEVALSLRRPPVYVAKWLGYELGAATVYPFRDDAGRSTVGGHHDASSFELCVDKFIEKYVLCEMCRSPETDLCVEEDAIACTCSACGHRAVFDDGHRMQQIILRFPPEHLAYSVRAINVSQEADAIAGRSLGGDELFRIAGGLESRNAADVRRAIAAALQARPSSITVLEEGRQLRNSDAVTSASFCVKQQMPTLQGPPAAVEAARGEATEKKSKKDKKDEKEQNDKKEKKDKKDQKEKKDKKKEMETNSGEDEYGDGEAKEKKSKKEKKDKTEQNDKKEKKDKKDRKENKDRKKETETYSGSVEKDIDET